MGSKNHLQEKNAICKPRQRINLAIAVGETCVWTPLAHDCSSKTYSKTSTIKEHVNTIRKQAQGAAHKAVEELDHHKGQIQSTPCQKDAYLSVVTDHVEDKTYTPKYAMRRESLSIRMLCIIDPGVERAIKNADILEWFPWR